jgi:hypothetical protein
MGPVPELLMLDGPWVDLWWAFRVAAERICKV